MTTKINPAKLLHSKWTASEPKNKEKHFIVTKVIRDENEQIIECAIEAVLTKNAYTINWQDLKDSDKWRQGWC